MILDPVYEHVNGQDIVIPFADPAGNIRGPEIETKLRRVHEFTCLTAFGSADNLAIDQPAHAIR